MQKITKLSLAIALIVLIASCKSGKKDENATINDKKAQLEKLKGEKNSKDEEIRKLQDELNRIDTTSADLAKIKLVSVTPVSTQNFEHYIDLQGKVDADNISYIAPRGAPGQVKALFVSQGQSVRKGQLLLKMDDAIMRQQVTASRQQAEGLKTQLSYAKNIYQRQKNLWDQGIGTEVQLITAKNNVEGLENQLKAAGESTQVAIEQLNTANVYSDVTGVADIVAVRVGETFTGMTATGPQIKIVNTSSLKVVTNVPENYLTRIHTGMPVNIKIPDANKDINTKVSLISQSVDPTQRGFVVEAKIPADGTLKPSQSAVVKILDYAAPNVIVIPINVVQSDETGKYVYVLTKSSNGKTTAHRLVVTIGEVYGENVEIKAGLKAGDQLVTEGFQTLYEGQMITTN